LEDDLGHGVGPDQRPEPLVDPEREQDGTARDGRRRDRLDQPSVDPLNPDLRAGLDPGDRPKPRLDAKRRLRVPLALLDALDAVRHGQAGDGEQGQRSHDPPAGQVTSHANTPPMN